jgi:hypothetical protein
MPALSTVTLFLLAALGLLLIPVSPCGPAMKPCCSRSKGVKERRPDISTRSIKKRKANLCLESTFGRRGGLGGVCGKLGVVHFARQGADEAARYEPEGG